MIYKCLGLMSGTSLDGVDGAICVTDGNNIVRFEKTYFRPYNSKEQSVLKSKLNSWPENTNLDEALQIVQNAHLDVIKHFPEADLIGFHGQTLNHDPSLRRTFQLGDGEELAKLSGKKVIWDFRSSDMINGGQGAPLAPFFHFACVKLLKIKETVAFVNLGGVGNISLINSKMNLPEEKNSVIAFDTGPANAPINDFMFSRLGLSCDVNGDLAQRGKINKKIVDTVLNLNFFNKKPPKSLDRNDFSTVSELVSDLSNEDGAATLTAICVEAIIAAQKHLPSIPSRWLICGGGRKNRTIIRALQKRLENPVTTVDEEGLDGDMLEAQAFGYLAARVVNDLPLTSPTTTGCDNPTYGGKISQP